MLYTFKSPAAANLVMLEKNGAQLLTLIGKPLTPQGILTVAQIPDAIAALEAAVAGAAPDAPGEEAGGDDQEAVEPVLLHQRAAPFIELLQRSADAGEAVVWGV